MKRGGIEYHMKGRGGGKTYDLVKQLLEHMAAGKKVIIFAPTVRQGDVIMDMLRLRGYKGNARDITILSESAKTNAIGSHCDIVLVDNWEQFRSRDALLKEAQALVAGSKEGSIRVWVDTTHWRPCNVGAAEQYLNELLQEIQSGAVDVPLDILYRYEGAAELYERMTGKKMPTVHILATVRGRI